jgi:hypothetical protein
VVVLRPDKEVLVDEPAARISAQGNDGSGKCERMSSRASFTQRRALLGSTRNSFHPRHNSTTVQVKANSP